jgi:hypothetical protein
LGEDKWEKSRKIRTISEKWDDFVRVQYAQHKAQCFRIARLAKQQAALAKHELKVLTDQLGLPWKSPLDKVSGRTKRSPGFLETFLGKTFLGVVPLSVGELFFTFYKARQTDKKLKGIEDQLRSEASTIEAATLRGIETEKEMLSVVAEIRQLELDMGTIVTHKSYTSAVQTAAMLSLSLSRHVSAEIVELSQLTQDIANGGVPQLMIDTGRQLMDTDWVGGDYVLPAYEYPALAIPGEEPGTLELIFSFVTVKDILDLYRVEGIPYYDKEAGEMYLPELLYKNVAIDQQQRYFIALDEKQMLHCINAPCELTGVMRELAADPCTLRPFLGKKVVANCPANRYPATPLLKNTDLGVVYSIPEPKSGYLSCEDSDIPGHSGAVRLQKQGVVTIPEGCILHFEKPDMKFYGKPKTFGMLAPPIDTTGLTHKVNALTNFDYLNFLKSNGPAALVDFPFKFKNLSKKLAIARRIRKLMIWGGIALGVVILFWILGTIALCIIGRLQYKATRGFMRLGVKEWTDWVGMTGRPNKTVDQMGEDNEQLKQARRQEEETYLRVTAFRESWPKIFGTRWVKELKSTLGISSQQDGGDSPDSLASTASMDLITGYVEQGEDRLERADWSGPEACYLRSRFRSQDLHPNSEFEQRTTNGPDNQTQYSKGEGEQLPRNSKQE